MQHHLGSALAKALDLNLMRPAYQTTSLEERRGREENALNNTMRGSQQNPECGKLQDKQPSFANK